MRNYAEDEVSRSMWKRRGSPNGLRPKTAQEEEVETRIQQCHRDVPGMFNKSEPVCPSFDDDLSIGPNRTIRACSSQKIARRPETVSPGTRPPRPRRSPETLPAISTSSCSCEGKGSIHEPDLEASQCPMHPSVSLLDVLNHLMRSGTRSSLIVLCVLVFLLLVLLLLIFLVVILNSPATNSDSSAQSSTQDSVSRRSRARLSECLRLIPDFLNQPIASLRDLALLSNEINEDDLHEPNEIGAPQPNSTVSTSTSEEVLSPTFVPAILPAPQIMKKNFDQFSCYDQVNHYLCLSRVDGSCLLVFSSYPTSRSISVVELDRRISFQSENDEDYFKKHCKSSVFRYVPEPF